MLLLVKKFGNIRVSIPRKLPSLPKEEKSAIVWKKRKVPTTFSSQITPSGGDKKADKANTMKQSVKTKNTSKALVCILF